MSTAQSGEHTEVQAHDLDPRPCADTTAPLFACNMTSGETTPLRKLTQGLTWEHNHPTSRPCSSSASQNLTYTCPGEPHPSDLCNLRSTQYSPVFTHSSSMVCLGVGFCSLLQPHHSPIPYSFPKEWVLPASTHLVLKPIPLARHAVVPPCGCHHPLQRKAKSHGIQVLDANSQLNWLKGRLLSDSQYGVQALGYRATMGDSQNANMRCCAPESVGSLQQEPFST